MADGKGFAVVVKINLPPRQNYQSGHSIIVQGDTMDEVAKHLDDLGGTEGNGRVILATFAEEALAAGAQAVLAGGTASGGTPAPAGAGGSTTSTGGATGTSRGSSGNKPASESLLKLVSKKTGVPVEELGELTHKEATRRLKEAS